MDALTRAYRGLARRIHPDRFIDSPHKSETATRVSARLNQAYQVLRDPVRRADSLLNLYGGPSAAELREVPGPLLAEVMEMREQIAEANSAGDSSRLQALRHAIAARRESALAEIETLCGKLEDATEAARRDLRKLLNSMKYFDNLLNDLAEDPLPRATPALAS